jgi:hypothetical protein
MEILILAEMILGQVLGFLPVLCIITESAKNLTRHESSSVGSDGFPAVGVETCQSLKKSQLGRLRCILLLLPRPENSGSLGITDYRSQEGDVFLQKLKLGQFRIGR